MLTENRFPRRYFQRTCWTTSKWFVFSASWPLTMSWTPVPLSEDELAYYSKDSPWAKLGMAAVGFGFVRMLAIKGLLCCATLCLEYPGAHGLANRLEQLKLPELSKSISTLGTIGIGSSESSVSFYHNWLGCLSEAQLPDGSLVRSWTSLRNRSRSSNRRGQRTSQTVRWSAQLPTTP